MLENIRLSLKGIWSHKMRSVLTMLGIIIGISSIIMIVSIIQATSTMLTESLIGGGKNSISVSLYSVSDTYTPYNSLYEGKIEGIADIPDESIEEIEMIDGVVDVSPVYGKQYGISVFYNGAETDAETYGVEKDFFSVSELSLKSGRLFTEKDYEKKNNVIVISYSVATELFGSQDPIGKTVNIGSDMFVIVGVLNDTTDYDSVDSYMDYTNIIYSSMGGKIYVPSTAWPLVAGYDDNQNVVIRLENVEESVTVGNQAAEILNSNLNSDNYKYQSTSMAEDSEVLNTITTAISILLVGIASISLLVGGIGVMNIMLVSVTERTREIGLKKALGAKRRVILAQFLTEAIVLTSLGGLIGVIIGIGLSYLAGFIISMFGISMTITISIPAIIVSVVFSMCVGIIFGLVPSLKAAKLDPIDALRYE